MYETDDRPATQAVLKANLPSHYNSSADGRGGRVSPESTANTATEVQRTATADAPSALDRFRAIVIRITYKPWWGFRIGGDPDRYWLQVVFFAVDHDHADGTGDLASMRGRKWLLSTHMTPSEVVQTAFHAVLSAEEHECREQFMLDGVAVLGPHHDLLRLVTLARDNQLPQSFRAVPE